MFFEARVRRMDVIRHSPNLRTHFRAPIPSHPFIRYERGRGYTPQTKRKKRKTISLYSSTPIDTLVMLYISFFLAGDLFLVAT